MTTRRATTHRTRRGSGATALVTSIRTLLSVGVRTCAIGLASLLIGVTANAQQTIAPRTVAWSPFLGCWSTSSAGNAGPMVCIVPTDSSSRVEFLTVSGDSVISRTLVDASGQLQAQTRGNCVGWESSRWSRDSMRLYSHADYKCTNGDVERSDAILSMTHSDAFSHVERSVLDDTARATVVNFIVQLDTTVYPLEVRQRMRRLRPLAITDTELEVVSDLPASEMIEAATELDPGVVAAWLADRGQQSELTTAELRVMRTATLISSGTNRFIDKSWGAGRLVARDVSRFRTRYRSAVLQRFSFPDTRYQPTLSDNYLITPIMVNFGSPYPGSQSGFPWRAWP